MHPYRTRQNVRRAANVLQNAKAPPLENTQAMKSEPLKNSTNVSKPAGQVAQTDGHIVINNNSRLNRQTKILFLLGKGTFGKVFRCIYKKNQAAIKIIKNIKKYTDAAYHEIKVLNYIKKHDPEQRYRCIHLSEFFVHEGHVCMVFPLLDVSIFDFIKSNGYKPFPILHIQSFTRQLLHAIDFLHSHGITHTDLKPENLMLVDASHSICPFSRKKILRDTRIMLIDFGSAVFEHEYHPQVVSTRHYRAPEIILDLGWSIYSDMWSIGCILVEMFTGQALFQTHDNFEHLAIMQRVLGEIPSYMHTNDFFSNDCLKYPNSDTKDNSIKHVLKMQDLATIFENEAFKQRVFESQLPHFEQLRNEHLRKLLLALCMNLLDYNVETRFDSEQALSHFFLQEALEF